MYFAPIPWLSLVHVGCSWSLSVAPLSDLFSSICCTHGSILLTHFSYCSLTSTVRSFWDCRSWCYLVFTCISVCDSANCVFVCVEKVASFGLSTLMGTVSCVIPLFVSMRGLMELSGILILGSFLVFSFDWIFPVRP